MFQKSEANLDFLRSVDVDVLDGDAGRVGMQEHEVDGLENPGEVVHLHAVHQPCLGDGLLRSHGLL